MLLVGEGRMQGWLDIKAQRSNETQIVCDRPLGITSGR